MLTKQVNILSDRVIYLFNKSRSQPMKVKTNVKAGPGHNAH